MKALSLWQPWASAIALGLKTIETRSWATDYRGPLAIHAAKRVESDDERKEWYALFEDLGKARIAAGIPAGAIYPYPRGVVVATCELVAIRRVEDLVVDMPERDRLWGDFSPGRFGWVLRDVRRLDPPPPARGRQGLWSWP